MAILDDAAFEAILQSSRTILDAGNANSIAQDQASTKGTLKCYKTWLSKYAMKLLAAALGDQTAFNQALLPTQGQ